MTLRLNDIISTCETMILAHISAIEPSFQEQKIGFVLIPEHSKILERVSLGKIRVFNYRIFESSYNSVLDTGRIVYGIGENGKYKLSFRSDLLLSFQNGTPFNLKSLK